jgi:nitroreductase
MPDITLLEAIHTLRAIRTFSDAPVPDEAVHSVLEAATRAPSGANRQPWRFVVIRDVESKRRLSEWYASASSQRGYGARSPFIGGMTDVPVLVLVCVDHGRGAPGPGPITQGASIYPAVQNMVLTARGLGLGSTITTMHTREEAAVKAYFGVPESVETVALIPLGYPAQGEHFGGTTRKPVEEVTFTERWGEPASFATRESLSSDVTLAEAVRTQRAIRRFKADQVPDAALRTVLEAATRAPSGSNRQPWRFILIRDQEAKDLMAEWYLDSWKATYPNWQPARTALRIASNVYSSADYLAHHMADVPTLILVCTQKLSVGAYPGHITRSASVYPAVQNLLLSARALGLGTTLTTLHTRHEEEVVAYFGIPDDHETVALVPIGYPADGERFGRSKRKPVEEVTHYEKWGGNNTTA